MLKIHNITYIYVRRVHFNYLTCLKFVDLGVQSHCLPSGYNKCSALGISVYTVDFIMLHWLHAIDVYFIAALNTSDLRMMYKKNPHW